MKKEFQKPENTVDQLLKYGKLVVLTAILITTGYIGYKRAHQPPTWMAFAAATPITGSQVYWYETGSTAEGIPNTLHINGEVWSVFKTTELKDHTADAETFCSAKVIVYIQHEGNISQLKDVIWHEVFHAGACVHGGDTWWNSEKPDSRDHPGIYNLGHFMAEFESANPEFMRWAIQ